MIVCVMMPRDGVFLCVVLVWVAYCSGKVLEGVITPNELLIPKIVHALTLFMTRLSSQTLKRIRSTVEAYLVDTCEIESQVYTTGSMGQAMQAWETVASGVRCRVIRAGRQSDGDAEVQVGRETIEQAVRIILPYGTAMAVDYRIVVSGASYQVAGIENTLSQSAYVSVIGKRVL